MKQRFQISIGYVLLAQLIVVVAGLIWITPAGADKANEVVLPQPVTGSRLAASSLFLPAISKSDNSTTSSRRQVNAPYLASMTASGDPQFGEMAIFWFGRVTQTENFTDVRVGYDDTTLVVYAAVYDRRFWYDDSNNPPPAEFYKWDSASLYLKTGSSGGSLDSTAYRFDAEWYRQGKTPANYKAAYRGTGGAWSLAPSLLFEMSTGARGEGEPNTDTDKRGWAVRYTIPFSSIGLTGKPANGTLWRMAFVVHDRDDAAGTPIAEKAWPEEMTGAMPGSWGNLRFGLLPAYVPPQHTAGGMISVRDRVNGAVVPDASVGGNTTCGDGLDFWTQWGNALETIHDTTIFNIGNGSDIADWPCFSKYYVTFPLDAIPTTKVIVSATMTLYHFSNSGNMNDPDPNGRPKPSLIQIMTVGENWSSQTITWNNAPMAVENVSQLWVDPVNCDNGSGGLNWPCFPRTWDVSHAVADAYASGKPLRLAVYMADGNYHSGKYFIASDTDAWNVNGRPLLQINWGNPSP